MVGMLLQCGMDVIAVWYGGYRSVTDRIWENTLLCLYSLDDSMAWTNNVINLPLYWSLLFLAITKDDVIAGDFFSCF